MPWSKVRGLKKLTVNLLDAIRATQKAKSLRNELGHELVDSYCKRKLSQWNDFTRSITQRERDNTLDC